MLSSKLIIFGRLFAILPFSIFRDVANAIGVEGPFIAKTLLSTGVSSLVLIRDGTTLVAGTKTGSILVSSLRSNKIDVIQNLSWEQLEADEYDPKFPMFSLASSRDDESEMIFAGNGDRFVSIWRRDSNDFSFLCTLGPHTGWVKDIAYRKSTATLFSIGCNCIESWDCWKAEWNHLSKRKIENSPEMGSTLSSDLLSLCLIDDLCLVSGGVDGRMHLWSLDTLEIKPFFSCRSHDGRVNAMAFSAPLGFIFSVGHDGALVISEFQVGRLKTTLVVSVKGKPRLSTLCIIHEDLLGCRLALGTTCGQIIVMTAKVRQDNVSVVEENRIAIEDQAMIYTLRSCPIRRSILAGHAKGLVEISNLI